MRSDPGTSPGANGDNALRSLRRLAEPTRAGAPAALDPLRRFLEPKKRQRPGEQCEMCGTPIGDEHSHVVNIDSRNLLCTCRACYLLFTHEGAARGKYRAVPDRYLHDPAFEMSSGQWEAIQIPVNMAFFFFNSAQGRVVAFYPSPAGATESLLPLETWDEVIEANPTFAGLVPDVEALLLVRDGDGFECFLVPIDAAYDLVGRVKLNWKGFDGGEQAWREIEAFFEELRRRSKPVGRPAA
jgi:hypothetical protein